MATGRLSVIGMLGMAIGLLLFLAGMVTVAGGVGDAACGGLLAIALGLGFIVAAWFARAPPRR